MITLWSQLWLPLPWAHCNRDYTHTHGVTPADVTVRTLMVWLLLMLQSGHSWCDSCWCYSQDTHGVTPADVTVRTLMVWLLLTLVRTLMVWLLLMLQSGHSWCDSCWHYSQACITILGFFYLYFSLRWSHAGWPQANFVARDDPEHLINSLASTSQILGSLVCTARLVLCSIKRILWYTHQT